jgi:hypothetical protein
MSGMKILPYGNEIGQGKMRDGMKLARIRMNEGMKILPYENEIGQGKDEIKNENPALEE